MLLIRSRMLLLLAVTLAPLLAIAGRAQAIAGSRTTTTVSTRSGVTSTTVTTIPTAADGMVDDPCLGVSAGPPPAIDAWRRAQFDKGRVAPAPPLAEFEAYNKRRAVEASRDWADLCHYRADNRRLVIAPLAERRIVFMGDSITENWGLADPSFFNHGLVNRGISGQTSPQMLLRFEADVVALHPRAVHIMAGTNDIAGNTGPTEVQAFLNNIAAMVAIAKANNIAVMLAAIPPAAAFSWRPALRPAAQLAAVNRLLADYARREKILFVDYTPALAAADGAFKPALTLDGVHPNAAGYAVMEPIARAALTRLGL
jgi:acyl-CoA thioesterase I